MSILPDDQLSPVVRAAIAALDAFGALDRDDADALLHSWCRRHELSADQRRAVLDHYPGYSRETEPTGSTGPVPDGVEGHPATGREAPWA